MTNSDLLRAALFGRAIVRELLTDGQLDVRADYDCEIIRMTGKGVSVREAAVEIFKVLEVGKYVGNISPVAKEEECGYCGGTGEVACSSTNYMSCPVCSKRAKQGSE